MDTVNVSNATGALQAYRSPHLRAYLAVDIAAALMALSTKAEIDLLQRAVAGESITEAEALANYARQQLVSMISWACTPQARWPSLRGCTWHRGCGGMDMSKRRRATVVAEQGGNILLVKELGARRYGLPGGGIERRESVIEASCREVREETGLTVVQAEYLFDYEGHVMFN